MSEPSEPDAKLLRDLTAIELRKYAKDHGLRITHLAQRRREDLVVLIEEAMVARQQNA